MLAFQGPSFSPAGGGKGPVPYFPVVVCMWQGWEKTVLRSHAFLRVWGPLGWCGLWILHSCLARCSEVCPISFPGCQTVFLRMNTPSVLSIATSRLVTLSLGFSVGILKSLFGNPEKWIIAFFLSHSGYSPNSAQDNMDSCVWLRNREAWEREKGIF